jgi:hypothetical protein
VLSISIWKQLKRGFNCVLDEWLNDVVLFHRKFVFLHPSTQISISKSDFLKTNHSQLDQVA